MSTQGAVQIQVTINNQSITIKKDHLVSLKIKRVIGDSADEFTLEAFDETAWKLENAMMGKALAPISVSYSAANNLTKAIMFTGTCLDYQLSFVGRATMLSITGVLSASAGEIDGWWFDTRSVEWCGSQPIQNSDGTWSIDGKSKYDYENWESNEDVCAILDFPVDSNGNVATTPTAYFNPTRIFKRIIHKYNGDKLGSISGGTTTTYQNYNSIGGLSKTNTTNTVWNYFKDKGFSYASIAGIMGNIQQESSFDPSCLQGGKGPAAGLFQWENYSTKSARWLSLYNFATKRGTDWTDLITQLDYSYSEMVSYGMIDNLKSLTNVTEATEYFEKTFERAGNPLMEKRISYASTYLLLYAGLTTEVTTTTTTIAGAIEGWGTGGTGKFKIAEEPDASRWVSGIDTKQTKETAAQYINRVLCKNAVADTGKAYADEAAGFKYWVDAKGHHFKAINYDDSSAVKLNVTYGMQNSQVISFSIAKIGVMAMIGSQTDSDGNALLDTSSLSYLYGDQITSGGENVKDSGYTVDNATKQAENINWWFANVQSVKIVSSASQADLNTKMSSTFTDLKNFSYSAELTLWGEYSKGYAPGDFLDLIVTGASGIQHYSSGLYMILSIDDSISSEGYTQTLTLLKLQKSSTKSSTNSGTYLKTDIRDESGTVLKDNSAAGTSSTTTTTVTTLSPTQNIPVPSATSNTSTYNRPVTIPDYSKYHITSGTSKYNITLKQ